MKYIVGMRSGAMMYTRIPSSIKTYSAIQKLIKGIYRDRISLFLFFKIWKLS
jgi:hypothetical protein